MQNEKIRHYIGAVGVFLVVIFLLMFLAFNEIPAKNKDIFVSSVGVITGALGAILATISGRDPDREKQLQKKVDTQAAQIESLVNQKDELEGMLIKIQESLIDNMAILGSIVFDTKLNTKNKKNE